VIKKHHRKICFTFALFYFLTTFVCCSLAHAENMVGEVCYDASVEQQIIFEIQQCRIDKQILQEQDELLKIKDQIIDGKNQLLQVKDDIISAKNVQIKTLQATEVIKQLEDVISVQGNVISGLRPSTFERIIGLILWVVTFGAIGGI